MTWDIFCSCCGHLVCALGVELEGEEYAWWLDMELGFKDSTQTSDGYCKTLAAAKRAATAEAKRALKEMGME